MFLVVSSQRERTRYQSRASWFRIYLRDHDVHLDSVSILTSCKVEKSKVVYA